MKRAMVVNVRHSAYDVLIDRSTRWGNPFSHQKGTKAKFLVATRTEAIEKYEAWIKTQPHLMAALPELKNKVLGCHCVPFRCHGEVLVRLANGEGDEAT
jgi:hypothetical protein